MVCQAPQWNVTIYMNIDMNTLWFTSKCYTNEEVGKDL